MFAQPKYLNIFPSDLVVGQNVLFRETQRTNISSNIFGFYQKKCLSKKLISKVKGGKWRKNYKDDQLSFRQSCAAAAQSFHNKSQSAEEELSDQDQVSMNRHLISSWKKWYWQKELRLDQRKHTKWRRRRFHFGACCPKKKIYLSPSSNFLTRHRWRISKHPALSSEIL